MDIGERERFMAGVGNVDSNSKEPPLAEKRRGIKVRDHEGQANPAHQTAVDP